MLIYTKLIIICQVLSGNLVLSSTWFLTHYINLAFHLWLWPEVESTILPYSHQPFIQKRNYIAQVIKWVSQPVSCLALEPRSSGFAHHVLLNIMHNQLPKALISFYVSVG